MKRLRPKKAGSILRNFYFMEFATSKLLLNVLILNFYLFSRGPLNYRSMQLEGQELMV